jgi:hypothetical protein
LTVKNGLDTTRTTAGFAVSTKFTVVADFGSVRNPVPEIVSAVPPAAEPQTLPDGQLVPSVPAVAMLETVGTTFWYVYCDVKAFDGFTAGLEPLGVLTMT